MSLPNFVYLDGEIKPYNDTRIGLMTNSLHYGTAAFGGIRGYWNADEQQLFIFRPRDHYRRVLQSATLLRMEFPYSPDDLVLGMREILRKENYRENCYIRPLIFLSDEKLGVKLHGLKASVAIMSIPWGEYLSNVTDMHLTFSSWRRIDDNMIPARGKIAGAYVNSALIKTDAVLAGFDDALVLAEDGHLSEGSAMNFFMVRDGVVVTTEITQNILEGITRRTVIQLLKEQFGLPVVERTIDRTEIFLADEVFTCGSGTGIGIVTRIDHRKVGTGKPGNVASQLRELYENVVCGKVAQYRDWCYPVYE
ncbi:MAG TPA: branched-chain amino acid transaminase [Anaerolineales bacterium]|nr:branched-chain amino acid transaminase [Anaerolineales bacterium]